MTVISFDQVERAVARAFHIPQVSLHSTPDSSKLQDAIDMLLVMCREVLQVSTDDILEHYSFLSRTALLNRIYDTYKYMDGDKRMMDIYYRLRTQLKEE